jgi:hypothetical protein
VSAIPCEKLDLYGLGKRVCSESDSFTMRAFPVLVSGPSDIQVRAPGKSRPS